MNETTTSTERTEDAPLRIVYMGTPEFAVPSLEILLNNGYEIAGVITAPDRLGGRGRKQVIESAVKKFATQHGLNILQPKNLKSKEFNQKLRSLEADLQVVVAFRMLPEMVWSMPRLGTINLHGSLLPKYRGAAPINWAVISGEAETGLSTFFIQQKIDTGNLLRQVSLPIGPNETAGELHDRMMTLGAELVLDTVNAIAAGTYEEIAQDHSAATKAPKIFHDMCRIDFKRSSNQIHNFVRGLSPWPGAWTTLEGRQLKVLRTEILDSHDLHPGQLKVDMGKLLVGSATSDVSLLEVQLQGKKRMEAASFINGLKQDTYVLT